MKKLRIGVVMGGPSSEYEVSLRSGAMVVEHLDRKKYIATPVVISRRGKWPMSFAEFRKRFDIAFNAMHGEYGEDGTVQTLFEKLHIPYTGSGVAASKLGMDKVASMKLFKRTHLTVPPYRLLTRSFSPKLKSRLSDDRRIVEILKTLRLPLVVKPTRCGSSVGVTIVKHERELARAVQRAFRYAPRVIIQQFVAGREVTCGVIEKQGKLLALPPTEIVPKGSSFFDYRAKYAKGGSDEITPARISKTETRKVQRAAILAHRAIGASGYSRSDFILQEPTTNNSKLTTWILEINTLPGLTEGSLLPKAARAAGISFPRLLDLIIESGRKKI